jgi:hypothetical protein
MRFGAGGIVFLALLNLAPAAQGTPRYASPTGSGTACAANAPCLLQEAADGAKPGDEVIVGPGTYGLGNEPVPLPLEVPNIGIHGEFGGPRPVIVTSYPGYGIFVLDADVEYLEIVNGGNEGTAIGCGGNGRIDRVRAVATGSSVAAIRSTGLSSTCTVSNSVAIAAGLAASGLYTGSYQGDATTVVRNVTAIATGAESVGIRSTYPGASGGSHTLDLRNSIVRGGENDLAAIHNLEGPGNIRVSNSNFVSHAEYGGAKTIDEGGNQTAEPTFVDAAHGDYREAAGSPTIDAGVNDRLGPFDLDGNARVLGAAPDIGAYEFAPPAVGAPAGARIQALSVAPNAFRAANIGGAIVSAKKAKAPVAATVAYVLSAAATVKFTVERKVSGRKAGKRCVKRTKANKSGKKCALYKPVKGDFSHSGAAGLNTFKFSGRIGGKGLAPGRYQLLGKTGTSSVAAGFRIVK